MSNTLEIDLHLTVGDMRKNGLEARWGKTRSGRPALFVRNPKAAARFQRETWWVVDSAMFESMKRDGVIEAFTSYTLLGNVFSVSL